VGDAGGRERTSRRIQAKERVSAKASRKTARRIPRRRGVGRRSHAMTLGLVGAGGMKGEMAFGVRDGSGLARSSGE